MSGDFGPSSDDRVTIFGDEYTEYLGSYHPGTGAMVAMGCEADMGLDASGLAYNDGMLMTQIGVEVGSRYHGQHNGMATIGYDGVSQYDDTQHMADIGYDMYSEYNASENQFAPYMGFGPGMAQTNYPHGPGYDEPDMGFDIGGRRIGGGTDTRGAAINAGLAAGGAAVGLHFGGPPGALIGAAIGGAIRSLIG